MKWKLLLVCRERAGTNRKLSDKLILLRIDFYLCFSNRNQSMGGGSSHIRHISALDCSCKFAYSSTNENFGCD